MKFVFLRGSTSRKVACPTTAFPLTQPGGKRLEANPFSHGGPRSADLPMKRVVENTCPYQLVSRGWGQDGGWNGVGGRMENFGCEEKCACGGGWGWRGGSVYTWVNGIRWKWFGWTSYLGWVRVGCWG